MRIRLTALWCWIWCPAGKRFFIRQPVPVRPVSYTHLDVYKRQLLSRAYEADISVVHNPLSGKLEITTRENVKTKRLEEHLLHRICHTPEAVSYTHLDVYKRQF